MLSRCSTYLKQHEINLQRTCSLQNDDNFACWFFCISPYILRSSSIHTFICFCIAAEISRNPKRSPKAALKQDEENQAFPE